jgi:hypothetical protein
MSALRADDRNQRCCAMSERDSDILPLKRQASTPREVGMVRRPAAETRQLIAGLMSRDDTAGNDRFQRDNAKFSSRCVMASATRGTQLSTGSATATANCGSSPINDG